MNDMILIVEDEPKLASLLSDYLKQSGFDTHILTDGLHVAAWVKQHSPSLMILDLMLPSKDGMEVCKEVRQFSELPIIMATARVEEIDRLLGLELGADDYVCKPFSYREIVARVKAILRRIEKTNVKGQSSLSQMVELDKDKYQAKIQGTLLDLTVVEFNLLLVLASEPGRIYQREQLMQTIYKEYRVVSDRTIDSHIKKLRKKIKAIYPEELIHSVYGLGYKFEES
ncbi:MAG: two-component system response regulator BaeR [Oleiphilaceae bacterium]|jgi:two-component system response regulator BaeR